MFGEDGESIHGLPFATDTWAMVYNTEIMEEAGIEAIPETWDELLECLAADGTCTLRAAVEEANSQRGPNTIAFGIAGNQVHTIAVGSTLTLNDRSGGTTIDGYTQAGAAPNTDPLESNATIRIEVTAATNIGAILQIESAGNTVRGLSIYGPTTYRMLLQGEDADGNRIVGNFIGFNTTLTATSPAGNGMQIDLGPDRNLIGTAAVADRNVISGNRGWGIRSNHGETSQNTYENNIFGIGPRMEPLGNGGGLDLQWWTWGNYVTGNLFANLRGQGIDLSHSTTNNAIINNRFGTFADGNSASADTTVRWGVTFKDNPTRSYLADNVFANATETAVWGRHNYNDPTIVVNNRIGVGSGGAALGNALGVRLIGHDDLYLGNIIANNGVGVVITDDTFDPNSPFTNFPSEETLGNRFYQSTFYNNGGERDIVFDAAFIPHNGIGAPTVTGIGPGEVYGTTCANCEVEVFVSGTVLGDGTLDTTTGGAGAGAGWIGRAQANGAGQWGLAHPDIQAGNDLRTHTVDPDGNTSQTSDPSPVPTTFTGSGSNAAGSLAPVGVPAPPPRPPVWEADPFTCSWANGTLSWENEGAAEYFLRTVAADGSEQYIGARTGTSAAVPDAAGYRVVNWAQGFARSATCGGPGDPVAPPSFTCTVDGATLSWTDQGVDRYYIRTVDAAGNDTYLTSTTGTSVTVPPSAGYLVIHWVGGRNAATCAGAGDLPAFSCSVAGATLSWTDQGVDRYYIRTVDAAGNDTYLSSTTDTSIAVPPAAGYQVIHWVGGRNVAACDSP
ncbi:MAG: extracellular solute-binding protein [Actinomycetota bacterium]